MVDFAVHVCLLFPNIGVFYSLQVLLNLTRPYRKVTIAFIARELALDVPEVEALLVDMILDEKLDAHIDQIKGHVVLKNSAIGGSGASGSAAAQGQPVQESKALGSSEELFVALGVWADKLALLNENFGAKIM
jgi:hypothetical protein